MCAPPFATKQRPPIWKILDPPLTTVVLTRHLYCYIWNFVVPVCMFGGDEFLKYQDRLILDNLDGQ